MFLFGGNDIEADGHTTDLQGAGVVEQIVCFDPFDGSEARDLQVVVEELQGQANHMMVIGVCLAAKGDPHQGKALFHIELWMQEQSAQRFEVWHADPECSARRQDAVTFL